MSVKTYYLAPNFTTAPPPAGAIKLGSIKPPGLHIPEIGGSGPKLWNVVNEGTSIVTPKVVTAVILILMEKQAPTFLNDVCIDMPDWCLRI
jgi:hypothetical protein